LQEARALSKAREASAGDFLGHAACIIKPNGVSVGDTRAAAFSNLSWLAQDVSGGKILTDEFRGGAIDKVLDFCKIIERSVEVFDRWPSRRRE